VIDQRGSRVRAGRVAGGGVAATIVVVLVAQLFGVDVSGLIGGGQSAPRSDQPNPPSGPDPDAELVDFVNFVLKDIQDTFDMKFKAAGKEYRHAARVMFTSAVDTGCGRSSAAIGPFYCPPDEHAYIDLSFYRELRQRFGAPGDFAQAYVLAHEIGHHLQNVLGTERRTESIGRGRTRNETSVRVELQADCYAGVWAHAAQGRRILEAGDLDEALTAATAIGDDRLQKQAGREVHPETFTHGSSEQRVRWFRRGFEAGELDACDTFSARQL
jgi:predicted metalloprotease